MKELKYRSERTEVLEYGLTPGCSVPVDGNLLYFFDTFYNANVEEYC